MRCGPGGKPVHTLFAVAAAVITGTAVCAQESGGTQAPGVPDHPRAGPGLTIGTTSGDYFILSPPPRPPVSQIVVRPDWSQAGELLDVERMEPGDSALRFQLSIDWRATAVCSSGLSSVQIDGPGGSINQEIDNAPMIIEGTARYQSFDIEAADQVCISWLEAELEDCAQNVNCPVVSFANIFEFGPENPLPGSTPITISSTCVSGGTPEKDIIPRLELHCVAVIN